MSFSRVSTSIMSRGRSPRALHRSTWKASVSSRGEASNTHCSGVLETTPPSQKYSPSISVAGNPGGSEPLAMTCSGPIFVSIVSKIDQVARPDMSRADTEPNVVRVYPVEVDQPAEQGLERRDVVVAEISRAADRGEHRRRNAGLEEARCAPQQGAQGAGLIDELMHQVVLDVGRRTVGETEWSLGDGFPEFAQMLDSPLRRIAGDQGGIDGADRDAGDPVGVEVSLGQGLIDAALIGAERTAALQQEGDTFEVRSDPRSPLVRCLRPSIPWRTFPAV